jgi:SAM-dependent methyltransferase
MAKLPEHAHLGFASMSMEPGQLRVHLLQVPGAARLIWSGGLPTPAPVAFAHDLWIENATRIDLPQLCADEVIIGPGAFSAEIIPSAARCLRIGGCLACSEDITTPAWAGALDAAGLRPSEKRQHHFVAVKVAETAQPKQPPPAPPHREGGYALLSGEGLEIGALNEPAKLPAGLRVRYFDVVDEYAARTLFPEMDPASLVHVDFVGNIDTGGLGAFAEGQFDFVVCNHVIEHVANPVRLVDDLMRITRPGGHVVITAPDKRFTFDHERPLTPFEHLWEDFQNGVTENTDAHYWEFIRHVVPHVLAESVENQRFHLARCRERKEHAHVWDSDSFSNFLLEALSRLRRKAKLVYSSHGDENRLEYFSVWQRR